MPIAIVHCFQLLSFDPEPAGSNWGGRAFFVMNRKDMKYNLSGFCRRRRRIHTEHMQQVKTVIENKQVLG